METSSQEESYDFFNLMDVYNQDDEKALESALQADSSYKKLCTFDGDVFSGKRTEYETICAKFKYLNFLLFGNTMEETNLNYHSEYMNFWLNYKLKSISNSNVCAQDFYQELKTHDLTFNSEDKIKIKNINDDNLKLMTKIYDLYSSYNEINQIINADSDDFTQCSRYSKECVQKYDDAIKICQRDKVTNFCKALNVFKEKYDQLKNDYNFVDGCKIEELKPHPSDKNLLMVSAVKGSGSEDSVVPSSISEDQGSTAGFGVVTGTISTILGILPISLILYKTTPFGSWISNRYFKKKNIHEIIEDEENYESLLSTSGSHDITSAHAGYKLSYNSL
ncbi:PIR Superfamily Protein [Plasmodium ovale wallikeri]|uniref:PIR Superfamily Protein n=1 Tax=Plasmodium ovale wallikeri TaxID=864142 RepID=A0A1A9ALS1_PLAOA|nr:PIR Superfamily Protein [Plasmodium ovale wallikeri]SBT57674.1 PIR Superfamily Protein [Plasmodium ovale wallikeri]